jgi:glucan phosphoethanolaminetransferase (alkaline phosphatase superfamily)
MKLVIVYMLLCLLDQFSFSWGWFWGLMLISVIAAGISMFIEHNK